MYLIAKPAHDKLQPYVSWCGGNWWSENWIDAVLFPGPEAAQRQVQALGLTEYIIHISPHQTTRVGRDGNLEGLVVSIEENERLRVALRGAEEALTDLPTNQSCAGVRMAQEIIEDALAHDCQKKASK